MYVSYPADDPLPTVGQVVGAGVAKISECQLVFGWVGRSCVSTGDGGQID